MPAVYQKPPGIWAATPKRRLLWALQQVHRHLTEDPVHTPEIAAVQSRLERTLVDPVREFPWDSWYARLEKLLPKPAEKDDGGAMTSADLESGGLKGPDQGLRRRRRTYQIPVEKAHSGAFMALIPSEEDARRLAVAGGEGADELHVTLAFFGAAADLDKAARETILHAAGVWAHRDPIDAPLSKLAIFHGDADGDGRDPLIALVDSSKLVWQRKELIGLLERYGVPIDNTHPDYKPHLTLAYIGTTEFDPVGSPQIPSVHLDTLLVGFGGERHLLPLDGVHEVIVKETPKLSPQVLAQIELTVQNLVDAMDQPTTEDVLRARRAAVSNVVSKLGVNFKPADLAAALQLTMTEVVGITDSTREMLRNTLIDTLQRAANYQPGDPSATQFDFAREIRQKWQGLSQNRAETIARTEYNTAASAATHLSNQEQGFTHKVWFTVSDGEVCDECDQNASQGEIPIDEPFDSGDMYPPLHPNCRCNVASAMGAGEDQLIQRSAMVKSDDALVERLSALEHGQWVAWSKNIVEDEKIDPERVARWKTLWVPYADLSEEDKDKDREWARKVIATIGIGKAATMTDEAILKYSDDQPRDEGGKWSAGGGGGASDSSSVGPEPQFHAGGDYHAYSQAREAWNKKMTTEVALGRISPEVAQKNGWSSEGQAQDWKPLPAELYHVTSAADAVVAEGLKVRADLPASAGLGGGTEGLVSFTTDRKIADEIHRGMNEIRDVALGKTTAKDVLAEAHKHGIDYFDGKGDIEALLRGVKVHNGETFGAPPKEPGEWKPSPDSGHWMGGDGKVRYAKWERPLTQAEKIDATGQMWKGMSMLRESKGGPFDPLFWGDSWKRLADVNPAQIRVLQFSPKPDARGQQVGGMKEIRTVPAAVTDPKIVKYSDDQPRAEDGKWTDGGGGGSAGASEAAKPGHTPATAIPAGSASSVADVPDKDRYGQIAAEKKFIERGLGGTEAYMAHPDGTPIDTAALRNNIHNENVRYKLHEDIRESIAAQVFSSPGGKEAAQAYIAAHDKNLANWGRGPSGMTESEAVRNATSDMLNGWGHSSNNGSTSSMATQISAARALGMPKEVEAEIRQKFSVDIRSLPAAEQVLDDHLAAHDAIEQRAIKAIYDRTQKELADHGITHVTLYRGLGFTTKDAAKLPAFMNKGGKGAIKANPLSSWTSSKTQATEFAKIHMTIPAGLGGETRPHAVVMSATFPASRIVSTARTGFGVLPEYEFVVAAGPGDAKAEIVSKP